MHTFARVTLAVIPFVICNIIVMALLIAYPELVTSVLSALK
jgi:TRAP-type mannitol/chloroaromatic compound transport system permease large subunit